MASVRAHLAALTEHFATFAKQAYASKFALDEDTITFRLGADGSRLGQVSLVCNERSAYPHTGGLAFADGTDALMAAVESVADRVSASVDLATCLPALFAAAGGPAQQLAGLPAAGGGASGSGSGAASSAAVSSAVAASADESDGYDDEASDSDGGADDEDQANLDYDFARGAELENNLMRLRHKWETQDQARREAADAVATAAAAAAAAVPAPPPKRLRPGQKETKPPVKRGAHQIFSSAEATRMLCNELYELMKEEAEGFDGVSADCVDYNIHKWRVKVSDVDASSPLKADLTELASRGGSAALEFELLFTPDMHPFYPLTLNVVRPRFQGVVAEAVMTHPVMTLQGWDPMKPIKWYIRAAQQFLEKNGRVALDDPRNLPASHPEGAYSEVEVAICRCMPGTLDRADGGHFSLSTAGTFRSAGSSSSRARSRSGPLPTPSCWPRVRPRWTWSAYASSTSARRSRSRRALPRRAAGRRAWATATRGPRAARPGMWPRRRRRRRRCVLSPDSASPLPPPCLPLQPPLPPPLSATSRCGP